MSKSKISERSWQKDMDMYMSATPGPYGWDTLDIGGDTAPYKIHVVITPSGEFGEAEAELCSQAPEALKHWLQEVRDEKERADRWKADALKTQDALNQAALEIGRLKKEISKMTEAR